MSTQRTPLASLLPETDRCTSGPDLVSSALRPVYREDLNLERTPTRHRTTTTTISTPRRPRRARTSRGRRTQTTRVTCGQPPQDRSLLPQVSTHVPSVTRNISLTVLLNRICPDASSINIYHPSPTTQNAPIPPMKDRLSSPTPTDKRSDELIRSAGGRQSPNAALLGTSPPVSSLSTSPSARIDFGASHAATPWVV